MKSATQLSAAIAVRERAALFFLGQRDGMRFHKEFGDVASGRDSLAVVTAQKFDHGVAVLDDSCVLLWCNLNVIFGAAGFGAGTSIEAGTNSRVTSKMSLKDCTGVDSNPVDIGQQSLFFERAHIPAPSGLVEVTQPSL